MLNGIDIEFSQSVERSKAICFPKCFLITGSHISQKESFTRFLILFVGFDEALSDVAEALFLALVKFDHSVKKNNSLQEIHIVDVNSEKMGVLSGLLKSKFQRVTYL